jgi:hypothetical protein
MFQITTFLLPVVFMFPFTSASVARLSENFIGRLAAWEQFHLNQ